MPETYLITGGAGNLACQLSFDLVARGRRVVLFDVAERPASDVAPGCEYVRGDLTRGADVAALIDRHRPGVILHFASLLSGASEQDRDLAWRVNMDGAFGLLEAAVRTGVRQFFFPSSVATYGGAVPSPLPEDFPQWPTGLYGATKVACERLGVYYHARHGLDFRCIRVPIVLSRFAPAGAASAYASRAFIDGVLAGRFTFRVAPQIRACAVYVKDVLTGIMALLDAPAARLTRRVYNIHGLSPSVDELTAAIAARVAGVDFRFDPDPAVVAMIGGWPSEIDDAAARRDWGWRPAYDLDRMADDFIAELRRTPGPAAGGPT